MSRLVATTGKVCPLGCKYCFAADPNYVKPLNITTAEYIAVNGSKLFDSSVEAIFNTKG
jgi:sulfatase maturation enzyme AslB (radical SAM superfamily)